jgi:hypothetical protein
LFLLSSVVLFLGVFPNFVLKPIHITCATFLAHFQSVLFLVNNLILMPQLDIVSYSPQIIWVLFFFVVLFVFISKGFLPVLGRIFWFREFKKSGFVTSFGSIEKLRIKLGSDQEEVVRIVVPLFNSVVRFYFGNFKILKASKIKLIW